jgi:hypothetical protein
VIVASLVAAVVGVLISRLALHRLARRPGGLDPSQAWLLGLLGVLPGWVVAFEGLLGVVDAPVGPVRLAFVGASAGGLVGVIVTDVLVRRLRATRARPVATYWLLGLLAMTPAWLVTLLGLSVATR